MDFFLFDSMYPLKSWSKSHWSYVVGGTLRNGHSWMMGTSRNLSAWVVLMSWICKGIIFIHIWVVILVHFLWALQLSWTDSVMQCWGLAMFVGATRTCPLLGVHEFSGVLHNSCSRSVKWHKMCVETGWRTFRDSSRACRAVTLCWKNFLQWSFIFQAPSMVCIGHYPFWSKKNWEQFYSVFKKKNKLNTRDKHTKKNPIPCWINEGRPKTAIIYMLSFFQCCRWGK